MSAMAAQITSLLVAYSTVYSGAGQRKHQSSTSLAFVRGIHRWPVNSPHKGPVTRKTFHLMTSSCSASILGSCAQRWKVGWCYHAIAYIGAGYRMNNIVSSTDTRGTPKDRFGVLIVCHHRPCSRQVTEWMKCDVAIHPPPTVYPWGILVGVSGSYPTKAVALLLGESRAYVCHW